VKGGRVLLAEGERLVLELRSHWYRLIGPALVLVATSGTGSFLAATVPESDARVTLRWIIGATCAALVLRWSVWPFLVWYANSYMLTTRRLIIREGVMARRGHDIPLVRITDASFTRTLLQRMLGCGRLTISTSGSTAGQRGNVVIDDVPLIEDVQRAIQGLVSGAPRPVAADPPDPPWADPPAWPDQARPQTRPDEPRRVS
jgi:uncharacterized membrane protein YdbT with pleckstrin-like domain